MLEAKDKKLLLGFIGASIITYNIGKRLYCYWRSREPEWIPVGTVKQLFIHPVKSCKGNSVFSFYCSKKGPKRGEMRDRYFQVINGENGRFYTARQKPQMVLIDCDIDQGKLTLRFPDGRAEIVDVEEVKKNNDVRETTLHDKLRQDGLDCGENVSKVLSDFLDEPNTRLVMFQEGLFNERICIPDQSWWNNPVPKRADETGYADLAPYMIQTEASLTDLNTRLEKPVIQRNFRPVIVVDQCPAWDEDKWADLKIGGAQLQCYKPCTRCVLTTINPETGVKSKDLQPLKKLREFRLAPAGPMREEFKDDPMFGVNAGADVEGWIHVGQVVYARYKPSAF